MIVRAGRGPVPGLAVPTLALALSFVLAGAVQARDPGGSPAGYAVDDRAVAEALAAARQLYSRVPHRCGIAGPPGEITVCAPGDSARWRVPGTSDSDPDAKAARDTGVPQAPDFSGGSCRGRPGCSIGGWAPPPVYMIDLATLPPPPAGSDAERVARGEMSDR